MKIQKSDSHIYMQPIILSLSQQRKHNILDYVIFTNFPIRGLCLKATNLQRVQYPWHTATLTWPLIAVSVVILCYATSYNCSKT